MLYIKRKTRKKKKHSNEKKVINTDTGLVQMKVEYFKEAYQQSKNLGNR